MSDTQWQKIISHLSELMNIEGFDHQFYQLSSDTTDFRYGHDVELRSHSVRLICLGPSQSSGPSFVRFEYGLPDAPVNRWDVVTDYKNLEKKHTISAFQVLEGPNRLVLGGGAWISESSMAAAFDTYDTLFDTFVELLIPLEEGGRENWDPLSPESPPFEYSQSHYLAARPQSKDKLFIGSSLIGATALVTLATFLVDPALGFLTIWGVAPYSLAGGALSLGMHFTRYDAPPLTKHIRKKVVSSAIFDEVTPVRAVPPLRPILIRDRNYGKRVFGNGTYRAGIFEASSDELNLKVGIYSLDTKWEIKAECRIVPSKWAVLELQAPNDVIARIPELSGEEREGGLILWHIKGEDLDAEKVVELLTSLSIALDANEAGPYR